MTPLDRIARRLTWRGDCLEYDGSRSAGYGMAAYRGTPTQVHRIVWIELYGQPPAETLYVRHACDNPPCCNPAHLLLGDQRANMGDCVRRGRHGNQKKTTCASGHDLTQIVPNENGHRICGPCARLRSREYRARRKAVA